MLSSNPEQTKQPEIMYAYGYNLYFVLWTIPSSHALDESYYIQNIVTLINSVLLLIDWEWIKSVLINALAKSTSFSYNT